MVIYLTGGLTFIPFVIFAFFYVQNLLEQSKEQKQDQDSGTSATPLLVKEIDPDFRAGEFEEAKGVKVFRRGWLTVTRKYYYHHTELAPPSCDDSTNNIESDTPLRSQLKKKHKFYAILRHGNLFLYRDNLPKSSLIHAISLQGSFITMWPRNPNSELSDSALFTNKTCISIWRKGTAKYEDDLQFLANDNSEDESSSTKQFFLYFENTMEKEDWYFDLINVSKSELTKDDKNSNVMDPNVSANTAHLNTPDMLYLIQTINSTENQLTAQWINALVGRLFLSLQRTDKLKNYLHGKLYDKLKKLNKPDFLEDLAVQEVNVGISAPIITNPKLMELSPEGLTKVSLDFRYKGDISVMVTAKATINLGLHFKQREVPMQLSIKLKELSGPAVLLLKPPPSNRLWYTFVCEPIFEVEIEPVVSSSKLSYTVITNAIKSKLAEAIKESIVMPNWDDLVFYDTDDEIYRGGIWEKYDRHKKAENSSAEGTEGQDKQEISLPLPVDPQVGSGKQVETKNDDLDHNTVENNDDSVDALRTQDPTLKRRTLLKVENLKKVLKTKSRDDSSDDLSMNEVNMEKSSVIGDSEASEDSAGSKKYFKNPMKKIGKWYKETVNNLPNAENDDSSDLENETAPKTYAPEMISNRRDLPKRPIPSTISTSANSATDGSSSTTSPTLNATEMFANKDRNKSLSSASSNEQNIGSFSPSNYNKSLPQAFVKVRNTRDFHEGLFDESLEERVSSTQLDENNQFKADLATDLKTFCNKIEQKVEQKVDAHTNLHLSDNAKKNNAT